MIETPRFFPTARLLFALLAVAAPSSLAAQQQVYSMSGFAPGDRLGHSVGAAGDVNGDGTADLAVGAPRSDAAGVNAGQVIVVSGADQSVLLTLNGTTSARLGSSVSAAGDVNGDGYADLIIGAPNDSSVSFDAGSAQVISGADGSVLYRFDGDGGDHLGAAVAGAGDVNGDGYDDVIVGAPLDDNNGVNSGSASVFSGKTGELLHRFDGAAAGDAFGDAVGGAGDVDGDCLADLIVGAPQADGALWDAGSAYVYSGADGSELLEVSGVGAAERMGHAVAGAGDVDLDGRADVIVGAPGNGTGSAVILSGATGSALWTLVGQSPGENFGWSVTGGTDIDADGYPDQVVGSPGPAGQPGSARAFSGLDGSEIAALHGTVAGDAFGASVAVTADVSGDGFPDIVAGAPESVVAAVSVGAVDVYALVAYGEHTLLSELTPGSPGAHYGARMSSAGDFNGDGVEDYMIAAPLDFGKLGSVRVYSGVDHSEIRTLFGSSLDINFGIRLAPVGDLNNDGYDDVIIGAYHDDTVARDSGMATVFSGNSNTTLLTILGTGFRAHLGTAVGALGSDVDGDGTNDLFVGLGLDNNERGAARIVSGKTGATLRQIDGTASGQWLGWDGAAVGDWDGDGIGDFAVGAPAGQVLPTPGRGYVTVRSGADASEIVRFTGINSRDRFGWVVKNAGDVNADGVDDLVVGSDGFDKGAFPDAGRAVILSGADRAILRSHLGEGAGDNFGKGVGPAGDVNGDGYADYFVGAPGADPNGIDDAGRAYLFSGRDGALLQTFDGDTAGDSLGISMIGTADTNGDGYSEVVVSVHLDDAKGLDAGSALLMESQVARDPGGFAVYGPSCPSSNGALPRIQMSGRPAGGETFSVELTTAPANAAATLGFDFQPQAIDLGVLGLPGCSLLTLHRLGFGMVTDGAGKAGLDVAVPLGTPLGVAYCQWVIVDAGSAAGLTLSNGGHITIGK